MLIDVKSHNSKAPLNVKLVAASHFHFSFSFSFSFLIFIFIFSFSYEEYICQQNESINDLKKNTGQICLHFTDSSLIFDSLISVKTLSNFVESIMFPPSLLGFNCQTDSRQKQPARVYPVTTASKIRQEINSLFRHKL